MSRFQTRVAAALLALPAVGLLWPVPRAAAVAMDTVQLQVLDKITARVSTLRVPVGQTVPFGALQITARACDKHPPEETPESAAFLEVVEVKPDEKPVQIFRGWMFASSPALSALEDPVYDLVVLDCVNSAENGPAAPASPGGDQKPGDAKTGDAKTGTAKPAATQPSQ